MLPICILAIRDDDDRAYMTRLFVKYQRLMYRTIYDTIKTTTPEKPVISGLPGLSVTNALLFSLL